MPQTRNKPSMVSAPLGQSPSTRRAQASSSTSQAVSAAERDGEADRGDRHEKVERDSFSMPASEHRHIKALREGLGRIGVLATKSEVLRAGLALLAEREPSEIARLIDALPKVAKGKRGKKR